MSQSKIWACPNGCDIETVLVCGGDLGREGKPNIYFHMQLNGSYTHLHADGYGSVPDECHEHADGGCCMEPNCPECKADCIQVVSDPDESGR
jgi:hypothetical protein